MNPMQAIVSFLGERRFAIAGVSQKPNDFSRTLFREFLARGYDAVPVNPAAQEIEGRRCFARVQDIMPPVEAVLTMTSPAVTEKIVRDCAEAGVKRVWMYRATGKGAVSDEAVAYCESQGIEVIPGECPYMFLPGSGWIHRVHGLVRQITGTYPQDQ
jgi:predicted CoA-binding protein